MSPCCNDLGAANCYLEASFLAELNRQFNVKPKRKADVHRSVPRDVQLSRVSSFQETRVVLQNDWTVVWSICGPDRIIRGSGRSSAPSSHRATGGRAVFARQGKIV